MRHPGVVNSHSKDLKGNQVINKGYLQATHQRRRDTANQKPRCWSQYNLREHQLDLPRKDRKGRGADPKSAIFDGKPWDDGILWDFGVPNSHDVIEFPLDPWFSYRVSQLGLIGSSLCFWAVKDLGKLQHANAKKLPGGSVLW